MRKSIASVLMLILAVPALAVEGSDVAYVGGTVPSVKEGVVGRIDLTLDKELVFQFAGGRLDIPYSGIESYEQSQEVTVHLGVAPAIAVGLMKHRKKNHYVRFTFSDSENRHQVAVFEVPKTMPMVLTPILLARAPRAHRGAYPDCGPAAKGMRDTAVPCAVAR
jgi:hypothetical protein